MRTVAKSIVLKDVQSPERLLDETALFLHRVIGDAPRGEAADDRAAARVDRGPARPQGAGGRRRRAQHLRADDACSRTRRWRCSPPPTAARPSSIIKATPDLSVVLMDIMMPEMDGYETMREIRKDPRFRTLPILVADRQSDEGRSREVPGGGGVGLHRQTGEHRTAALAAPGLAVPLGCRRRHRHIAGRRRGAKPRRAGGDPREPELPAAAGRERRAGAAPAAGERRRGDRPRHQDAAGETASSWRR